MPTRVAQEPAWGAYPPRGKQKLLRSLVRLGLGHGDVKKLLQKLWFSHREMLPVDIVYEELKLRLYPWDNVVESKILFGSGLRDRREVQLLKHHLRPDSVFLDIGANIGYYALIAAHCGAIRIIAVEPNPTAYERLTFNIDANAFEDRITALPLALGDEDGRTVTLAVAAKDMGGSKIADSDDGREQVEVPMMRLSSLLAEQRIDRIDALKIDVEGMEDSVLYPFFESAPPSTWPRLVIIEHDGRLEWKRDVLSFMLDNGYVEIERNSSNAMLRLTGV
jgi:FkbM family methyltransferase